jgi:hypothetical protein
MIGSLIVALTAFTGALQAQKNVVQPGDPIIASSSNSPGSEGVANAIDGKPTKYLNFDTRTGGKPSGFVVTPSIGVTRVVGMALQSANDAPERDAKVVTLEGSNDETVTDFASGTWELIVRLDNIPAYTARFQTQTLMFDNFKAYKHYRFTVLETQTINGCCFQIAEVGLLGGLLPQDITQPGDPIIASSSNSPGSEGVANVIDGKPTKYLNFDTRIGGKPSGAVITPSVGRTVVTGMTMQSANDAPERDPKVVTLEGSNDDTVADFASGSWELIVRLDNIPAYTARFQTQTFLFNNIKPYKHYRWTVLETQTANGCCLQLAELELLGTGAPKDVTQPGDPIIASSSNSPGSEGVANAIDGKPTKYLNFDTRIGGKPSGFVVTPSVGATTITGVAMQSANDAPERDAKVVTIEGSNDETITDFASGTWELIVRLDNIPAYTARFQTQEFYFANAKSYKHYRFTVLETQTPNGCCFQIAEVELLAVTEGADCNKAKFLLQPVDTAVLSGAQATFFAVVNGPWPLQWYKDGEPIPGATGTTYTTAAVTAANANAVYSVQIVGCEMSAEVKAVIFAPSATKSIGVSFRGGGANGAPTLVRSNDIAGIFPQAYWNNTPNAGSGLFPYSEVINADTGEEAYYELLDSDGKITTVTFDWATSGTWGSGTGADSATQRALNGLNLANSQTDPATITFGNVPAGNHTVIAYLVGVPLQFQDADYTVVGQNSRTVYVRVMNADEYNAAPGFYRGVSTSPASRDLASLVRFDNVRPAADGTIRLEWLLKTGGYDRGVPVNAIQLVLNAPAAGAPPAITAQPQPSVGPEGGSATISVTATGEGLTYQWRKNGRNLPDGGNVSGARSATLRISNLSAADEGVYNVAVFNADGSVVSGNAALSLSKYSVQDALVGYWKFDETSGAAAANAVAGGKPGAVKGTSRWAAGQIANSFSFDGMTYLFVEDYTKAVKGVSASGWVRVDPSLGTSVTFIRNGLGEFRRPVSGDTPPTGQFEIGLDYDEVSGAFRLSAAIMVGPNFPRVTAPSAFPLGSWQHVAFSADGAQLRLYLNGAEVGVTDYLGTINPPDMKHLSIGAQLNLSADEPPQTIVDETNPQYMYGQLDDLGVWARGVSAEEIKKIYDAGKAGQPLTTVTLEPPVNDPATLGVSAANGNVTITWDNGTLQTAPAVSGPWTDSVEKSPLTEQASGAAKFYRAVNK